MMKRVATVLVPVLSLLVACGGSGDDDGAGSPDGGTAEADAAEQPDAGPSCSAAASGDQAFIGEDQTFIGWTAPVTSDIGDGGDVLVRWEFYSGIRADIVGTWDLSDEVDGNYATCASCVRLLTLDADGAIVRQFFQSGGTITLAEDPFATGGMVGSLTDVSLIEVTIDPSTYTSTPVVGGVCIALAATVALDADNTPPEWTCDAAAFNDGVTCDCACGATDPDCDITDAPVAGCDDGQVCVDAVCTTTCEVLATPAVGCTEGTCGFLDAVQDVCYTDATLIDGAVLGEVCLDTTTFCAVVDTVAAGLCDFYVENDAVCRQACASADDCEPGDTCSPVIGDRGLCITPAPPPANDTCGTAIGLTLATPEDGTSAGGISDVDLGLEAAGCTGFTQAGPDVMYSIALGAGDTITATLSDVSLGYDPSLAILGPGDATVCDAEPVVCVGGADVGLGGDGETLDFTAVDAGTYYIIVDTYYPDGDGTFTLTVTAP